MQIGNHYVDGYDYQNKVVYQFHGCFYNGYVKCFPADGYNRVLQKRFGALNEKTKSVTDYLKECEYVAERRIGAVDVKKANLMFWKHSRLRLRDALYGGRMCPVWLQKKCVGDEKIHYIHFTSLYPSVQKDFKYPVGHPHVLVGQECEGADLVKCDILLPKHLCFPVLQLKIKNIICFVICVQWNGKIDVIILMINRC